MEKKGEKRKEWGKPLPYAFYHLSTSGGAVAVATAVTHPLDVLKVRLQMQLVGQRGPLVGMGEILGKIVKVEGARGLYLGFAPALSRSVVYGGLRLGLYEPCKYVCDLMFGSTNLFVKIASGACSGALATALTNPMEVLKVRLQMNSGSSPIREMQRILSEEGIRALWKGVGPAMTRASALTASQLATYDESKQALLRWTHLEEGFHLHLISSCIAGTVSTLVTAPVDMIKTRLMLQKDYGDVGGYRNVFHATYQVILKEGVGALYKGLGIHMSGLDLVDPSLSSYDKDGAYRLVGVDLLCTQASPMSLGAAAVGTIFFCSGAALFEVKGFQFLLWFLLWQCCALSDEVLYSASLSGEVLCSAGCAVQWKLFLLQWSCQELIILLRMQSSPQIILKLISAGRQLLDLMTRIRSPISRVIVRSLLSHLL